MTQKSAKIISIHSFRGGTGKSNLTANIAAQVAKAGHRVAIIDTDIQSPGIHVLFGLDETTITRSLNDYLWGKTSINEVTYALHEICGQDPQRQFLADLKLWLIPSSIQTEEITRILQEGYNVGVLNQGLHTINTSLSLDYLFIDTHPGINEETLLSTAISHGLILIMRPDRQDFQGTAVTVDIAQQLEVPQIRLVVNKALAKFDPEQVKREVEGTYNIPVSAVLPLSEDVAENASHNLFSFLFPEHPWSLGIKKVAQDIMGFPGHYNKPD